MTRSWRATAATIALLALSMTSGCTEHLFGEVEEPRDDIVLIVNDLDEPVTVTYEVAEEDRTGLPLQQEHVPPSGTATISIVHRRDNCLVAPLVARTADGDEVGRLPAGHCLADGEDNPENQLVIR